MASKKKKQTKGAKDDWDDEKVTKKIASLNVASGSEDEDDDVSEEEVVKQKPARSAFALLADGDSDEDEKDSDEAKSDVDEPPPVKEERDKWKKDADQPTAAKSKKDKKKQDKKGKKADDQDAELAAVLDDLDTPAEKPAESQKSKKKGKKEKKTEQDDEIAALLESLDRAEDQLPEQPKGKKKGKKGKKAGADADDVDALVAELENPPAEKPVPLKTVEKPAVTEKEPSAEKEPSPEGAQAEGDEEDAAEGGTTKKDKKKKKKKKDKGGEEEETTDKTKKKPTSRIAAMILEQQRLIEEQKEAKLRAEEEEKRLEEEERLAEEERKRAEEKRKEEKKLRKAEEIARQKREGTFLTKKQKEQQARAQRLFQNQGIVLPPAVVEGDAAAKPKKPLYGKKKPPAKKPTADAEEKSTSPEAPEAAKVESAETPPEEAAAMDTAAEAEDEIVDDWEQIAEVSPVKPPASKTAKAEETRKRKADEPAESEESSEEEDEEESDEEESEEESESSEEETAKETKEQLVARIRARIKKRREQAEATRSTDNLRSPVICVLGHVDTGKTKMLDTIRRTNVQDGEAGGITQQIGATRVPDQAIKERCRMVTGFAPDQMTIPGFLIIDTPGHESFANLRSRGSSLCDIAILVVDIMHGLEPQTIESLKLLLKRETPFVIALNKASVIDRLYNYESNPRKDIWQLLKSQPQNTQLEFKERYEKIVTEFAEQGVNVVLANKNKDPDEYVSIVPTSAYLGDGIGNLMAHIVDQSQSRLAKRLAFCEELDCTVMEVRSLQGLGTTIDVILINGTLKVNDILVLTGTEGPIVTPVRDLLMPQPLREIRVKNEYEHYKEIKGAQGVKVLAKNLERAVAGLPLFVVRHSDELEVLREDAEQQLQKALMAIKKKAEGVYVQASTLGSLEALLEFLKTQKIPYSGVNIGPVHKKDVQKSAAMLEHNPEFACILAFDVPVDREVQVFADREGVRIFQADIIYHLEDAFLKYREELRLKRRRENEHLAIFPVRLRVLPQHIFNARNPIVCGVSVEAGQLKKGTPICAKTKDDVVVLGTVMSIERNHEQVDHAKAGDEVCIKIENTTGDAPKLYGRHFTHEDMLISRINRESIDVCKQYFREDLSKADWQLIIQLKKYLDIM